MNKNVGDDLMRLSFLIPARPDNCFGFDFQCAVIVDQTEDSDAGCSKFGRGSA